MLPAISRVMSRQVWARAPATALASTMAPRLRACRVPNLNRWVQVRTRCTAPPPKAKPNSAAAEVAKSAEAKLSPDTTKKAAGTAAKLAKMKRNKKLTAAGVGAIALVGFAYVRDDVYTASYDVYKTYMDPIKEVCPLTPSI
eukprot:SAG11_NODE_826_length_6982_cov_4.139038_1_plen_142_part_00